MDAARMNAITIAKGSKPRMIGRLALAVVMLAAFAVPATAAPPRAAIPSTSCRVWVSLGVTLRPLPNYQYASEQIIRLNEKVTVDGRDRSSSWLHVNAPTKGWVETYFLTCDTDVSRLNVLNKRERLHNATRTVETLFSCSERPLDTGRWQMAPGWRVVNTADRGPVLAGQGNAWASRSDQWLGDSIFISWLNLSSGTIHINFRRAGRTRYYVGFNAGELYLKKTVNGQQTDLTSVPAPHMPNTWHRVQVSVKGGHVEVTVDYTLELEFTDPNPLGPGGIAFETLQGASAQVDDVQVCPMR